MIEEGLRSVLMVKPGNGVVPFWYFCAGSSMLWNPAGVRQGMSGILGSCSRRQHDCYHLNRFCKWIGYMIYSLMFCCRDIVLAQQVVQVCGAGHFKSKKLEEARTSCGDL